MAGPAPRPLGYGPGVGGINQMDAIAGQTN